MMFAQYIEIVYFFGSTFEKDRAIFVKITSESLEILLI